MFDKLGYGVGNTILAAVAFVVGCPAYVRIVKSKRQCTNLTPFFSQNLVILALWQTDPWVEQACEVVRKVASQAHTTVYSRPFDEYITLYL